MKYQSEFKKFELINSTASFNMKVQDPFKPSDYQIFPYEMNVFSTMNLNAND